MIVRQILPEEKEIYNQGANHPIQSWEWGEFKEKTGMRPIRLAAFEKGKIESTFQVLLRPIPKTSFSAGQVLKSDLPSKEITEALKELALKEKIIFIKIEPDYIVRRWKNSRGKLEEKPIKDEEIDLSQIGLEKTGKILFDPNSFLIDLTQAEDQLLAGMHPKTRYNIRLAERHGVKVREKSDQEGLEIFIKLFQETLKRQRFYMHSPDYFRKLWQVLGPAGIGHIFLAEYQEKILSAWMVFVWKDKIYYPYGASSTEHRNLMASNLICWELIKFGKKKNCRVFDMWGSLGSEPDPKHPWFGFHKFKLGYGGDLVEFIGSWDLVNNSILYQGLQLTDSIRWKLLRLRRKLPF